jgi:hypothetical protein
MTDATCFDVLLLVCQMNTRHRVLQAEPKFVSSTCKFVLVILIFIKLLEPHFVSS